MKHRKEPFEGSEEERFQKALAKCRNCSHVRMAHSLIQNRCVDSKFSVTGKYKQCRCKKYVPIDNLEFLELKCNEKKVRE